MKRFFLLALLLPVFARADFHRRCVEQYGTLPTLNWSPERLAPGTQALIPTRDIWATQRRFAQRIITENLENPPDEKPIDVVIWDNRAFTLDGHHKLMTNIMLGRAETRVNVVYNFTGLTESAFRAQMLELAYIEDEEHGPDFLNPCEMRNDPYLYLVRMFILRATVDKDTGEVKIGRGSRQPLVVKINGGPTYSELRMAADMQRADIKYKPKWGERFKGGITRTIRKVLAKSKWMREQTHLMVLPKRMSVDDSALPELIGAFWRREDRPCGEKLNRLPPRMPKVSGEGH